MRVTTCNTMTFVVSSTCELKNKTQEHCLLRPQELDEKLDSGLHDTLIL